MSRAVSTLAWDDLCFEVAFRSVARRHQGVSIRVLDAKAQRIRFDCYDDAAHYHYDPDGRDERHWHEPVLHPPPLEWALSMIGRNLPQMIIAAGGVPPLVGPSATFMRDLHDLTLATDERFRQVLLHHPGDYLVAAGALTFGLRFDPEGDGVALRVLRSHQGELEELLGFDCFRRDPHYHYGPRHKNAVIPLDPAVTDDALDWTLDVLRTGRLPFLLARAGYPEVGALVAGSGETARILIQEVEPLARRLRDHGRRVEAAQ